MYPPIRAFTLLFLNLMFTESAAAGFTQVLLDFADSGVVLITLFYGIGRGAIWAFIYSHWLPPWLFRLAP